MTAARLWPTSLPISTREGDGLPSAHQVEQALRAMAGPVGILAGSPGTGKTHTLAFILREVLRTVGRVQRRRCGVHGHSCRSRFAVARATRARAQGYNHPSATRHWQERPRDGW